MSGLDMFTDTFNATDQAAGTEVKKPFAFREDKSKEGTLNWLNQNFESTYNRSFSRLQTYRNNLNLFKGIHWKAFNSTNRDTTHTSSDNKPKMVQNFVAEMTETKVAQMMAIESNISLIPNNDEQSDINNAVACKKLLLARGEELNMKMVQADAEMVKFLYGHVFLHIWWNEDIGPYHPSFEKVMKIAEISGDVAKVKKKIEKTLKKDSIHIGDVCVDILEPDMVFPEQDVAKWEDVNHCDIIWKYKNIEEVEYDYPHAKGKLTSAKDHAWDYDSNEMYQPENKVMLRIFYHKKTKYLPDGARIIYCNDVILEDGPLPYNHGQIPLVADKDIDVRKELWGRSFISRIEQKQRYYNNIESCNAQSIMMMGRPKIVAPEKSLKIKQIGNNISLVEFKGVIPPKWEVHNTIATDSLNIQDRTEKKIAQDSQIYDVTRGEVPKGVTATSAMRLIDEQESQRIRRPVASRKHRILCTYKMMMQVMAQYYQSDDGRMIKILGKNNEYLIKSVKDADFARVYDIRFENSPDLPDNKSGKISTIIDMNIATQTDPVFKRREIVQMLDLGLDETFKDRASVALNTARTNMEMIIEGRGAEVPQPRVFDDLLTEYDYFSMAIQEFSFKKKLDDATVKIVIDRLTVIETMMYDRAKKNMKFANMLMQREQYPMFAEFSEPLSSFAMPPQPMQAGANPSEPLNLPNQPQEIPDSTITRQQGEPT